MVIGGSLDVVADGVLVARVQVAELRGLFGRSRLSSCLGGGVFFLVRLAAEAFLAAAFKDILAATSLASKASSGMLGSSGMSGSSGSLACAETARGESIVLVSGNE
jgi:hypothetical protein